jgi:hypothetical protein
MAQTGSNPISNLMYDWITILQSKAEGLHAYEKYLKDAEAEHSQECVQLLRKLHQQDAAQVQEIRQHVAMMMSRK